MQLQTKFNIGEAVWAVIKEYSKEFVNTESIHTYFYNYRVSGPHFVTKIFIDVAEGKTNIFYQLEGITDVTINETYIRHIEEDANIMAEIQNDVTSHTKADIMGKYA